MLACLTYALLLSISLPTYDVNLRIAEGKITEIPAVFRSLEELKASPNQSYWVKLELDLETSQSFVIQSGNWYMQSTSFFDENRNLLGKGNTLKIVGSGKKSYYLFYPFADLKNPDFFTISILRENDFLKKKYKTDTFQIAFLSTLIFIFFVAAFFTLRGRDNVYFHYALYIISIIIFFSYQYGILGNTIPWIRQISPIWFWIFSASLSYCYILFARSFLNLKENDVFAHKVLLIGQVYIGLIVLTETISYLLGYDILHQLWYKSIVLVIQFALMILLLYRVFLLRTIISNIFLAGAFILIATTITGQAASTIKLVDETNQFVQAGLLLDAIILSIGIAVRVGLIQKARAKAQKELIDQLRVNEQLQQEYTEKLEGQVSERTATLKKRNEENETLLKEVHHRVKNNLQMISSLLSMQQRRLESQAAKDALSLTKNRVKSIGLIHEHLYRHESFSSIHLGQYIEQLTKMIISSYQGLDPELEMDILDGKVDIETAIPIGIILNELTTNSLKYAFKQVKCPKLSIRLYEENGQLVLAFMDNGPGTNEEENKSGFGTTIINTLLDNVNGSIKKETLNPGYLVTISFTNYELTSISYEQ